ncbi:unnamed protein product [Clonostachys byssicola]|uniref:Uncharacterized protein n=1 Tax=Clonostachys byssicola TaxID=160290 RepID=A0A9N9UFY4_9HYPO|nr:unnamed protein product [Clonostachys byssicola]
MSLACSEKEKKPGLGAGRVQSMTLLGICDMRCRYALRVVLRSLEWCKISQMPADPLTPVALKIPVLPVS